MNFQIPNSARAILKAGAPVAKNQKLPAEDSSRLAPLAFPVMLQSFRSLEAQKTAAAHKAGDGTQNLFILESRGNFGAFNPAAQGGKINPQREETATSIKIPMLPPANLSHVRAPESDTSHPSAENIQTQAAVHQSVGSIQDLGLMQRPIQNLREGAPVSGITMRFPHVSTPPILNESLASLTGRASEFLPLPPNVFETQQIQCRGPANGSVAEAAPKLDEFQIYAMNRRMTDVINTPIDANPPSKSGQLIELYTSGRGGKHLYLETAGIRILSDSSAGGSAGADQDSSELPLPLHGNPDAQKGKEAAGIRQTGSGRGFIGQATMGIIQGPSEPKTKKDAAATSKSGAAASAQSPSSAKISSKSGTTVAVASEKMVPFMSREAKIVGEAIQHQAPPPPSRLEYLRNLSQLAEKIKACAQLRQGMDTVLEFQLTPPRLGSLIMRVQTEGQEMRLYFGAEQEGSQQMLKEMRADLTQIAAGQGYDLERCEVEHQAMPDYRHSAESAVWADRQRSSHPMGEPSNAFTTGISEEIIEESPRMLDFGYNTFDLVA
ncbi:MAG TPA: flagellar hook-length control protein FliK [bacterium]